METCIILNLIIFKTTKKMARKLSTIAPDWWDYTTLENDLISDAASLSAKELEQLSRPGFRVVMYDLSLIHISEPTRPY